MEKANSFWLPMSPEVAISDNEKDPDYVDNEGFTESDDNDEQFRNSRSGARPPRSQIDHDIFDGLPVNKFHQVRHFYGAPQKTQPSNEKPDIWNTELPMPKDSHLYPAHSQALLRAARRCQPPRASPVVEEEEKDEGVDGDSSDHAVGKGFLGYKWVVYPRHEEPPDRVYLAPRRKGLPSLYGASAGPVKNIVVPHPLMRKALVKKADASGKEDIYELIVLEGQIIENEVLETAPGKFVPVRQTATVLEGVGDVNTEGAVVTSDVNAATPPRKRPLPPKRKAKGPGKGSKTKKVKFAPGEGVDVVTGGGIVEGNVVVDEAGTNGGIGSHIEELNGKNGVGDHGDEDDEEGEDSEEEESGDEGQVDTEVKEAEAENSESVHVRQQQPAAPRDSTPPKTESVPEQQQQPAAPQDSNPTDLLPTVPQQIQTPIIDSILTVPTDDKEDENAVMDLTNNGEIVVEKSDLVLQDIADRMDVDSDQPVVLSNEPAIPEPDAVIAAILPEDHAVTDGLAEPQPLTISAIEDKIEDSTTPTVAATIPDDQIMNQVPSEQVEEMKAGAEIAKEAVDPMSSTVTDSTVEAATEAIEVMEVSPKNETLEEKASVNPEA